MHKTDLVLSHDQLVSAAISLIEVDDDLKSPLFGDTGYSLRRLEITLVSSKNHTYTGDLLAQCDERNISLVIECKTHDSTISEGQLLGYLSTTGEDIVRKGVPVPDATSHQSQSMFFVLPTVTKSLVEAIRRHPNYPLIGWGIVELTMEKLISRHSEFDDPPLSDRFSNHQAINFEAVSLERLPFSPSCPSSKLVDAIFSTLVSFLVSGKHDFTVEELCASANPLFTMMPDQQELIKKRVRKHVIAIRKNALFKWIKSVPKGSTTEDHWEFTVGPNIPMQTIQAFSSRHRVYVQYMLDTGELPKKAMLDYRDEQLILPLVYNTVARSAK